MSGAVQVFAIVSRKPDVCTCPKRDCPRHGNCQQCRNYHLNRRPPLPPYCERKRGLWRRLFGKAPGIAKKA
jgi:hypothetical protein